MVKQIITSILDTDTYKLTMQQAVLQLFPRAVVTYRFKNRGDHRFNAEFLRKLKEQIYLMKNIKLTPLEYSYLQKNTPFLKSWYLDCLAAYRYKPYEVECFLSNDGDLIIQIKGLWSSTILWEVPLMAMISELYFTEIDTDWVFDENDIFEKAIEKGKRLADAGCKTTELGTRRRRGLEVQRIVLDGLQYGAERYLLGTSNVMLAMERNLKPFGTMAHEWIMGNSILEGLYNANYFALQNWVRVYHADLGIALTDTYGLNSFIRNFGLEAAKLYDGVRHDSACPFAFTDSMEKMYRDLNIKTQSKAIVYSDGLNIRKAIEIQKYAEKKFITGYGMGTHLTNDFDGSPALNMVIKLWSCAKNETEREMPVVKLGEGEGKVMGDPEAVKVAQYMHQNKSLDKESK